MSDAAAPKPEPRSPQSRADAALEAKEAHKYLLAKTFFDCREFDRCATVFLSQGPVAESEASAPTVARGARGKGKTRLSTPTKPVQKPPTTDISRRSLFLALYARYLSGEKRKDEESEMILGPSDGGVTINHNLTDIIKILDEWFKESQNRGEDGGGWLEYLYGIVLAKNKSDDAARQWLIRSVNIFPYNWGAWQELFALLTSIEDLHAITMELPQNLMTFVFHIHANQELYQSSEAIFAQLNQIQSIFPHSNFLQTQRALLHYHVKDFEEASSVFQSILASEPHRLDSLDTYSNILYVMSNRPRLAFVAQLANSTDKFRPETCCVVGNYYSLTSQHEKAVMYFRRALTLDRNFLAAWTLMGHEYVEMKNTHAAIESYRRAVDVNRKDYRAWYGLGQTYEMLEMHSYALYYYQRAAALRPYDPKMWQAVGACLASVNKIDSAIKAYKRALVAGSYYDTNGSAGGSFGSQGSDGLGAFAGGVLDPEVLYAIALLYQQIGQLGECAMFMEMTLAQEEGPDEDELPPGAIPQAGVGVTPTTSKARLWLAKWEFERQNYQRAMELANELCQDGVEVEDAKALVRDVRSRVEADQASMSMRRGVEDVDRRMGRNA